MYYKITKCNAKNGESSDCGVYDEKDMKNIIKGYKFNGLFYERKNTYIFYIVDDVDR